MSGIFADHKGSGPRFYQAPPGEPLSRLAARGLLRRFGWPEAPDPFGLARTTIYVGTRRAARALQHAFAEAAQGPILTPRILAFPDLPPPAGALPAAPPLRRILIFARLARQLAKTAPDLAREEAAAALAAQIADLLDEMEAAKIAPEALSSLAPEDHAAHWGRSLEFLEIAIRLWPRIRAAMPAADASTLRVQAMEALMARWARDPPQTPVLVLGEAGRTPIERDFIRAAARLPQGAAILPWLDSTLGAEEWRSLADHPEHPACDAAALLALEGFPREDAPWWESEPAPAALARARLLGHALRPPPFTDAWRAAEREIAALAPGACAGLSLIEARSPREEAAAVAAVMRRALADPGRTVALVTPDRALGRRVAAALARWGIAADDSGGRPLALTPPGILMSLLAQTLCVGSGRALSAAELLSLLKHPLTAAAEEPPPPPGGESRRRRHLRLTRRYEVFALRGRRPAPGLAGMRAAIGAALEAAQAQAADRSDPDLHRRRAASEAEALEPWFAALEAQLQAFAALAAEPTVDFADLLAAHRAAALALTCGAVERGPTGEALKGFLDRLTEAAPDFGPVSPSVWPALFADLLRGEAARPPGGGHRRALIWGPADARAQSADMVILAGLNEGAWPEIPQPDGWLSRPMRRDLGLAPLEARVGALAQDFTRILCGSSEVWLSRARKQGGAPAAASRWMRRLEILLGGFAPEVWAAMRARGAAALRAALAFEAESGPAAPEPRPAPTPPLRRRPLRLSATQIETLVRDPYAIYAGSILGLAALPALDAEPDALLRGRVLHEALERFVKATEAGLPPDDEAARALFAEGLETALAALADRPALQESWRARGLGFLEAFLPRERLRRASGEAPRLLEARGATRILLRSGRGFLLTARADRIDSSPEGYVLIDYKSGSAPNGTAVKDYARQLPLEGAILRKGGFSGAPEGAPIAAYRYVTITPDSEEKDFSKFRKDGVADAAAFADSTLIELEDLLNRYEDPQTPYPPRLRPKHLRHESAFDHLARVGEWGGEDGDEDSEGEAEE